MWVQLMRSAFPRENRGDSMGKIFSSEISHKTQPRRRLQRHDRRRRSIVYTISTCLTILPRRLPTAERIGICIFFCSHNIIFSIVYDILRALSCALVTYLHLPIKVQLFVRPITTAVTRVGNDLISGRAVHRGQFHATNGTTESKAFSIYVDRARRHQLSTIWIQVYNNMPVRGRQLEIVSLKKPTGKCLKRTDCARTPKNRTETRKIIKIRKRNKKRFERKVTSTRKTRSTTTTTTGL